MLAVRMSVIVRVTFAVIVIMTVFAMRVIIVTVSIVAVVMITVIIRAGFCLNFFGVAMIGG